MRKAPWLGSLAAAWLALAPAQAQAFSTRVHIALANAVREAAIDGGGVLALRDSPYAVVLPAEDYDAIVAHPLAFRAGAIGPDNMVFPGMTDPSHAIGRRPYEQCEALYEAAATAEERAYALGCFLHGATDAVAHHFVNFFTGETFTLTPITAARQTDLDNAVRHIVVESMLQRALFQADPTAFDQGALLHAIPSGFLLRTYLDPSSDVWAMAAEEAYAAFEQARADDPEASLPTLVAGLDIGPADHLLLAPIYLAEIDAAVDQARADIEARIAELQDPNTPDGAQLGVGPGPDGMLGTKDDTTACAASCPTLYATYMTYVGLLAPRFDANQNELPSAFDKIADKFRDDLDAFGPAYLETVGGLSARLNQPLAGGEGGLDLEPWELEMLAQPMVDWAEQLTTVDYDTLLVAILPDWVVEMQMLLQQVGVSVPLAGIVEAVFAPVIEPIKQAIREQFIDYALGFVTDLVDQIEQAEAAIEAEVTNTLDALAARDLPGPWLEHVAASGLISHAFNLTAATLADHRVLLPAAGEDGPASFDASYTPAWSQAGLCDYLRPAVLPFGLDMTGLLTVALDGAPHPAEADTDSPVECHDGSLAMFTATPGPDNCGLVSLAALLDDPIGSVSRAYPPQVSPTSASCRNLEVPGLPAPPDDPGGATGGTTTGGTAGGSGGTDGGAGTGTDTDTAGGAAMEEGGGCGCRSAPGPRVGLWGLVVLAGLTRRRRRRGVKVAAAALAVGIAGCSGDDAGGGGSGGATGGTATTGTAGSSDTGTGTGTTDGSGTSTGGTATTTGPGTTTGGDDGLLDALDGTRWHAVLTRDGVERAYEIAFDTGSSLWSEIRNPYGPARLREMRSFTRDENGLFHTTVISPSGWPVHPENGRMDTWTIELVEGPPRQLMVTRDGVSETFDEGPFPPPESGMTAVVRVFTPGGTVDEAFCNSAGNGFDYKAIFDFANGKSDEIVAQDVVAGVSFLPWTDPTMNNQFSVTDLDGFDRYGGTELSDTFNFMVTYLADLDHPGGELSMREADDQVEDALWLFLGDDVGSDNPANLFLEVHGFIWPDGTPDEPVTNLPAGPVAVQAIAVRCTEPIKDVTPEIRLGAAPFTPFDQAPWTPVIDDALFPPAL